MNKIDIWLHDNQLTPDPNDYFARVKTRGNLSNKDIAKIMVKRGATLSEAVISALLDDSDGIKREKMAEGYSINTGVFHSRVGVSGAFHGKSDHYDPEEHKIIASFTSSTALREELKKTQVDILGIADTSPLIGKVIDSLSQKEDSVITPKNVLIIKGNRIKVIGDDPTVGLYLIDQNDNSRHKCEQFIRNNPKEINVMLPELSAGNYVLEIVTQFSSGYTPTKVPKTSQFEQILIVE